RRVLSGGVPAGSDVRDRRRPLWRPRLRRGAHLGGDHAERSAGFRVLIRILAGDDGAVGGRGPLLGHLGRAPQGGRLDGVDQESRRRDTAGDGGVLLHQGGAGLVTKYGLAIVAALVTPAALIAQDIGLPVGTQAPAVTVQDLDGKTVDLGRYVGKQPVLLEFWATWCPLCKALEPALKAAHA